MGCCVDSLKGDAPHQQSLRFSCSVVMQTPLITSSICFWSSTAIRRGLLPLSPPKSFILSRAICSVLLFLWFGRGVHCESCSPEFLFAGRPDGKSSSGFCLACLVGGSQLLAHLPGLAQLGCGALPWQLFFTCCWARGRSLPRFAGALSCAASSVFWLGNRLYLYKKNYSVLLQTSFLMLTHNWVATEEYFLSL